MLYIPPKLYYGTILYNRLVLSYTFCIRVLHCMCYLTECLVSWSLWPTEVYHLVVRLLTESVPMSCSC